MKYWNKQEDAFFKLNIFRKLTTTVCLQAQTCNFNKKETLAQVLSCEFCEITNNTPRGCFCRLEFIGPEESNLWAFWKSKVWPLPVIMMTYPRKTGFMTRLPFSANLVLECLCTSCFSHAPSAMPLYILISLKQLTLHNRLKIT